MKIVSARTAYEPEPLARALAFKGAKQTELWQTVAVLTSATGAVGVGSGSQGVLWSDRDVYLSRGEAEGNRLMYEVFARTAARAQGRSFEHPMDLLEELLPEAAEDARELTGRAELRPTFVLNALVALDNAAWQLYAHERRIATLEGALPPAYQTTFAARARRLLAIPLAGYATPAGEVARMVADGAHVVKVKLGADPDGDGDPGKMLEADASRVRELHAATGGRAKLYLDANGRYDTLARVAELLDRCRRCGALEHVVLLEEPFPEELGAPVGDLGVRVAADESAHSVADVRRRVALGYGAIALKPAGKTLTMTLRMAAAAHAVHVPCFVADLTVNPVLVEWNRAIAARLPPLPGLDDAAFETNGAQHYARWEAMSQDHPRAGAPWTRMDRWGFALDAEFWSVSGGIFEIPERLRRLVYPIS